MSATRNKVAGLRALLKGVGPECDWSVIHGDEIVDEDGEHIAHCERPKHAKLIAASRNALAALLDLAEGLAHYDDAMPCPLCDDGEGVHEDACLVGAAKDLLKVRP